MLGGAGVQYQSVGGPLCQAMEIGIYVKRGTTEEFCRGKKKSVF